MSSNPVSRPMWLIIRMISDRIGLHSGPLPLEIHLSDYFAKEKKAIELKKIIHFMIFVKMSAINT